MEQPQLQTVKNPKKHIFGALKINYVIYFYLTTVLLTPAYTYYMAVKHKEEPPFPHATVTNTACHYPQAQVFRWTMTNAGCFLTLIFHVLFRWFEVQARKYNYTGNTYSYMYWPCILSIFGYLAAIGTIDTGGTGTIHTVGAVYFFIMLYFMVVNFTLIARKMRNWDTRIMSRCSLNAKIVVATFLSLVWIYCLVGLVLEAIPTANGDDIYIVIVEWNLVYAGLIWVLCFVPDFKHVYIAFNSKTMNIGMYEDEQIHGVRQ